MNAHKKDLAIVAASALVGYCQSVFCGGTWSANSLEGWFNGLQKRVSATADAIEAVFNDSNDDVAL